METSTTLATTIVNLLSNYFAKDSTGLSEGAHYGLAEKLNGWVQSHINGSNTQKALSELKANPNDSDKQRALYQEIKTYLQDNPNAIDNLRGLVSQSEFSEGGDSPLFDTYIVTETIYTAQPTSLDDSDDMTSSRTQSMGATQTANMETSTTLATCAVNVLSHHLINHQDRLLEGKPTTTGDKLVNWIRRNLNDTEGQRALSRLESEPDNTMLQTDMIDEIRQYLDTHPTSKNELKALFSQSNFAGNDRNYDGASVKSSFWDKSENSASIAAMATTLVTNLLRNDNSSELRGETLSLTEKIIGWVKDKLPGDEGKNALSSLEDEPNNAGYQANLSNTIKRYLDRHPQGIKQLKDIFCETGFSNLGADVVPTDRTQAFEGAEVTPTSLATTAVNILSDYLSKDETARPNVEGTSLGSQLLRWVSEKLPGDKGLKALREFEEDPRDSSKQLDVVEKIRDYFDYNPDGLREMKSMLSEHGVHHLDDGLENASIITRLREMLDSFRL